MDTCQTIDFYHDWDVIAIFKVFHELGMNTNISKVDMMKKSGLQGKNIDDAINRINIRIEDCISYRPDFKQIIKDWLEDEANFLVYGKWSIGGRRLLGYRLSSNIEIAYISECKLILRVKKNGHSN